MRTLEKFRSSIGDDSILRDSVLKSIDGGRKLMSKYWCYEDTSEGTCCDNQTTITKDYDDLKQEEEITISNC